MVVSMCRRQHIQLSLVLVTLLVFLHNAAGRLPRQHEIICPNGFVRYFRSCYKFSQMHSSWVDSQAYCMSIGASLVTIQDRQEMKYLINYVRQHKELFRRSFWTGGNDIAAEGEWRWVGSLAPFTYTNWHVYQPDNGRLNEHCMELERAYHYQWNDQPCHLQNHFICEIVMY